MEIKYPFQIDKVMNRDNYTCQICGFYGVQKHDAIIRRCLECENKGFLFQPFPDWKIPQPCREKGLKYRICGECPQFKEVSVEYVSYSSLVVHHKDGNRENSALENLVTVCTSCHRRLHPRGRILTIDEVKKKSRKA